MALTPRDAMLMRRNEYLSRISIVDWTEPPDPVHPARDRRVAEVRRFRAGGDDVDPGSVAAGTPPSYTRATLGPDEGARAWDRHAKGQTDPSDWQNFARGIGGRYFGIPGEAAKMDLYRITGILVRSSERYRAHRAPPTASDLFDPLVSELPRLEESGDALSKAFALLQVCGVNMKPVEGAIVRVVEAADWSADRPLRDDVLAACRHELGKYYRTHPARGPAEEEKAGTTADDPAVTEAVTAAADALLAAFGDRSGHGIVADLRAVGLENPLIARLFRWLAASWDLVVRSGAGPSVASRAWCERHGFAVAASGKTPGGWDTAPRLFYLLQFLGRLSAGTVREACIRLAVLGKNQVFDGWPVTSREGAGSVWASIERLVRTGRVWAAEVEGTDDLPFRLAAMLYRSDDGKVTGIEAYNLALRPNLSTAPRQRLVDRLTSPGPNATPLDAFYWRTIVVGKTLGHILALHETADFHVCEHLRFLGHFRRGGRMRPIEGDAGYSADKERWLAGLIPDWFLDLSTAAILRFKFWIEDNWTFRADGREMTFWSENHVILFASAEYIAGQWWRDETFSHQNVSGAWHHERGRRHVRRWLEQHLRFGFAEVNSGVYYNYHIAPVLNLIDFSDDDAIRTLAIMVMDLLAFDVVRHVCQGAFVAASTRGYLSAKSSGWGVSIRDFVQLTTGTLGDFSDTSEPAALSLATSSYLHPDITRGMHFGAARPHLRLDHAFPECLTLIAVRNDVPSIERSRTSISMSDGERYGIGTESADDIVFWWSHGAYFTPRTYRVSQSWAKRWNLHECGPFKLFGKFDTVVARLLSAAGEGLVGAALLNRFSGLAVINSLMAMIFAAPVILRSLVDVVTTVLDLAVAVLDEAGKALGLLDEDNDRMRVAKTIVEQEVERLAIEFNKGSVIEREHLYVWRSTDAMLSSLIDDKKGETSAQKEVCIASLGPDVCVFANKPPADIQTSWTTDVERGLTAVPESAAVWETIPALAGGLGSSTGDRSIPAVGDLTASIGGSEAVSDGPAEWQGQSSNPLVWQYENVAIQIYNPTDLQKDISHGTHVFWPWERFDELSFETVGGGWWKFGRRDRRWPARTPRRPVAGEVLYPRGESLPDGRRREESGAGSGYVAVFSCYSYNAQTGRFLAPSMAGWEHREVAYDGHVNVMVTIVGDRALYGSFENFRADVLAAGLQVSRPDLRCSIRLPRPGLRSEAPPRSQVFEVSWEGGARLDGRPLSTDGWPRFELRPSTWSSATGLPFGVGTLAARESGRVDWDSQNWSIHADAIIEDGERRGQSLRLVLEHDFRNLDAPLRYANVMPGSTVRLLATEEPMEPELVAQVPNALVRDPRLRRRARTPRLDRTAHFKGAQHG